MKTITYQGWTATFENKILTITKDGESREYTIGEPTNGIEYKKGEEYFYIRAKYYYYQFKFEVDNFFVGDIFDNDGEFMDSFASHVFGEE
jgi:hypothetical protein